MRAPCAPRRRTGHTIISSEKQLSEIRRARQRGWALTDQELQEGLRSIAVPVHGREGTVVAAMNVSAHATRASAEDLRRETLPLLKEAARRLEGDL